MLLCNSDHLSRKTYRDALVPMTAHYFVFFIHSHLNSPLLIPALLPSITIMINDYYCNAFALVRSKAEANTMEASVGRTRWICIFLLLILILSTKRGMCKVFRDGGRPMRVRSAEPRLHAQGRDTRGGTVRGTTPNDFQSIYYTIIRPISKETSL